MAKRLPKCDCGTDRKPMLHAAHNACYCRACNRWLEPQCKDDKCVDCANRPERPMKKFREG